MTANLSVAAQSLAAYARSNGEESLAIDGVVRLLSILELPAGALDGLSDGAAVVNRWAQTLTDRGIEAEAVRDRLADTAAALTRVAGDFADIDVDTAIRLRDAAAGDEYASAVRHGYHDVVTLAPGGIDFDSAREGDPPTELLDDDTDTPGHHAMQAFRTEHLTTLQRAETLLREADRLDFTAPTQYLAALEPLKPGVIRRRADLASWAARRVGDCAAAVTDRTVALREGWTGGRAIDAVGDHADGTRGHLGELTGELDWLAGEAEQLWRLLDGLCADLASDAESHVERVNGSRIGRIAAAVELVEETRNYTVDGEGDLLWGSLTTHDDDAIVQVLYKRVWYLANAFGNSVDRTNQALRTLVDTTAHPADPAPRADPGENWPPAPAADDARN